MEQPEINSDNESARRGVSKSDAAWIVAICCLYIIILHISNYGLTPAATPCEPPGAPPGSYRPSLKRAGGVPDDADVNVDDPDADPGWVHFNPYRCAELHNQLLRLAISRMDPAPPLRRDLLNHAVTRIPDLADPQYTREDLLAHPPLRFLSLIDYPDPDMHNSPRFTPEYWPPHPATLLNDMYREDREENAPWAVLLYSDVEEGPDAGLIFDLAEGWAMTSRDYEGVGEQPVWFPLEIFLVKQLEGWQTGRFYFQPDAEAKIVTSYPWDESTMDMHPFVQQDLDDALKAWSELLTRIEERLPGSTAVCTDADGTGDNDGAKHGRERLPPLSEDVITPLADRLSPFAREFLARAPRPATFTFVGPGVSFFSDALFEELYATEDTSTPRLYHLRDKHGPHPCEAHEVNSLILPVTSPLDGRILTVRPAPPGDDKTDPRVTRARHFDKFEASMSVSRAAGLYVEGSCRPHSRADEAAFLTTEGSKELFRRGGKQPHETMGRQPWELWGLRPSVAEVLRHWAWLVEEGVWRVGPDGVREGHEEWCNVPPQTGPERVLPVSRVCRRDENASEEEGLESPYSRCM